ncbi:serine/threonine-protein kinase bud32 [Cladophialophora chaetospira]|uniref:EKC/KEOPS complex subunit BUD32 n=1 Tax=Cladophialophora chaetospira TaxID=386627 RepID=A0AA38X264_9EURO|nr:serine/threonine-protein kinase bud32 [Cladophialophora chaetospira]
MATTNTSDPPLLTPSQNEHQSSQILGPSVQEPPFVLPSPFTHTVPPPQLITQGAEALLFRTHFLSPSTPAALKFRPSKAYRHPTLDARLTKQRVLAEARILVKLSALGSDSGVCVPAVLSLEWDVARKVKGLSQDQRGGRSDGAGQGAWLLMEWIEGKGVKDLLREWDVWYKSLDHNAEGVPEQVAAAEEEVKKLLRRIGRAVGAMHSKGGVVHGDLTSSNIMIRPFTTSQTNGHGIANGDHHEAEQQDQSTPRPPDLNGEIVLIDFGLATQSIQDEDRAVDLYVLERAFGSTHPRQEGWFDAEVLQGQEGYRGSFKGSNVVLKRLDEVRLRGRKRSMVG